ncbi:Heat shock protein DnaJ isoform 2 [Hibiscus syriacus]|uniref:Heat shock protein DnaJ isoform 2 n=1 Tax=Hibiscus syriacus TaxID=106335 RepID=A0A6A2XII0_HIBSY|nr:Heat shock protein DnaJ isoform 2 [Hibiscus syriacus]
MDGNKDDALKCLNIGKEALDTGNRARALKFFTKARRLDPTLSVDDLLSAAAEIESVDRKAPESSGSCRPWSSDQPSIRQRNQSTRSAASSPSSSPTAAYTEEQIKILKQIKGKKDYYEILGLEKTCSAEDVRKAYRKLSLKVHPDKNKAPGAEEAFKAVSKAFQFLSNEESRKKYDLIGSDESVHQRKASAYGGGNGCNPFYRTEFHAYEIFRNFFGGMPPSTTQFPSSNYGTRRGNHGSNGSNVVMLIQLSYPYKHKFSAEKGLNFYVRSSAFEQDYPVNSPERLKMEENVESDYYSVLAQTCRVELQRQQWGFMGETPHCDLLHKFQPPA